MEQTTSYESHIRVRHGLMKAGWTEARQLLHLYAQIIGKIRLKLHPKLNHWWHCTLTITPVGWSTGLIPYGPLGIDCFEIEVNFIDHTVWVRKSNGRQRSVILRQPSVKDFYNALFKALHDLDIHVEINERPYDKEKVKSDIPFSTDDRPVSYDADFAHNLWRAQLEADVAFQIFRGRFNGKASPVQLFWHSFDLAVTFFSGRHAPEIPGQDPVTKEAYSHEVISFGFWPGDDFTPEPSFYAYAYPEPTDLANEDLRPHEAMWISQANGHLAILHHQDVRGSVHPRKKILTFMETFFQSACRKAQWEEDLCHLREESNPSLYS